MKNKIVNVVYQFHIDKATQLQKELDTRRNEGNKRLWKQEEELRMQLERLQNQINSHLEKAEVAKKVARPYQQSTNQNE